LMLQSKRSDASDLIHERNVFDYSPVGCLENTMVGNDRSGTVDANLNLLKAVELALTGGYDLVPFSDPLAGRTEAPRRWGQKTGDATAFEPGRISGTRTRFRPAASCAASWTCTRSQRQFALGSPQPPIYPAWCEAAPSRGLDITEGGAELNYVTIEAVTYATTVDSLLAVKYLVFDQKLCTMAELIQALKDNWVGHEVLQARACTRRRSMGGDDDAADRVARQVMELWTGETWKHKTRSTGRQFRPGMLSWNYWIADSLILPASPDGRPRGKFLSNALCPPTART